MSALPTYPDLNNKVALIVGIGQTGRPDSDTWGNGAATARVLSHSGVKIFGCDLSREAAEYTAARLRARGGTCDVMTADATSAADVQRVVDAAMEKHGRIDILVNNVGMTAPSDPATMDEDAWDRQLRLNLKTVFLSCRAVLPVMAKQGSGAVVNNASIAGLRYLGKPQAAYASAKAGVIQFTKVTAAMYAAKGVRLNCVVPGLMYTPLVENLGLSDNEADREVYRRITQHNVPMGRMGDSTDVANAVAFLASDAAKYVAGHALVVDGGITGSTGTGGARL